MGARVYKLLRGLLWSGPVFLCTAGLAADDVKLTRGKVYRNVLTRISEHSVSIRFRNGGRIVVPKRSIAWLINKPHDWRRKAPGSRKARAAKAADPRNSVAPAKKPDAGRRPGPGGQSAARAIKKNKKRAEPGAGSHGRAENSVANSCAFRSLVAPGWGQYACGNSYAGHGVIASLLFAGYGMFAAAQSHGAYSNAARTLRIAALSLPRRTFLVPLGYAAYERSLRIQAGRESAARSYRGLSLAVLAVYALQVAHAYALDQPRPEPADKGLSGVNLEFGADHARGDDSRRGNRLNASVRFRF